MVRSLSYTACFALLFAACSGPSPAPDAGSPPLDASARVDAASRSDAGTPPVDAGREPDDAGVRDAGAEPDAGTDAGTDAGIDGGVEVGPFQLFVATDGDDTSPGTRARPLRTLERAHAVLTASRPGRDVEIRIAPGVYVGQHVVWRYFDAAHTTRFLPRDWTGSGTPERPVFDGDGARMLFYLNRTSARSGARTNLEFHWLHLRDYVVAGLTFASNRDDPAGFSSHNRVEDCVFEDIGNVGGEPDAGLGGVVLSNTRDSAVLRSTFRRLVNTPADAGLIHGVYLSHHATGNVVSHNTFRTISGDPIRVRDASHFNTFHHNTFRDAGEAAIFGDWYCHDRPECVRRECPSFGNALRYSDLGCTGHGGAVVPLFYFHHGRACVPSGCPDLFMSGESRLVTSGNSLPDRDGDGTADCSLGPTQPRGSCP